jgi:hypothetical protein
MSPLIQQEGRSIAYGAFGGSQVWCLCGLVTRRHSERRKKIVAHSEPEPKEASFGSFDSVRKTQIRH